MLQYSGENCPAQNVFSAILFVILESAVIIEQEGVMSTATRTLASVMISNDPDVDTESLNKQRSWGLLRSVCIK